MSSWLVAVFSFFLVNQLYWSERLNSATLNCCKICSIYWSRLVSQCYNYQEIDEQIIGFCQRLATFLTRAPFDIQLRVIWPSIKSRFYYCHHDICSHKQQKQTEEKQKYRFENFHWTFGKNGNRYQNHKRLHPPTLFPDHVLDPKPHWS